MDPAIEQHFTDDLRADPVVKEYYDKTDYKSVPDVLKGFAHAQKRLGSVVPLPNGESKPEDIAAWRKEHLPRLESAGLVDKPRQAPDKYEIKLPEGVPAEAWTEADTQLAHGFAKKHGLSQEALNDGVAVVSSILGKAGAAVQVNREASIAKITEWAATEGVSLDQVNAAMKRYIDDPANGWDDETKEAMSLSGHADNPLVVKQLWKIAKDSGFFDTRNDGGSMDETATQDAKAATAEANDIIRNKANPKYAAYHKGDKDVNAYVEQLMKKAHPGTLEI